MKMDYQLIAPQKKLSASAARKEQIKATYPERLFDIPVGVRPVVLFSGGRTSALMLIKLVRMFRDFHLDFIICFANTGKEMPETLDFVKAVSENEGVEVVWLEYDRIDARLIPAGIFPTDRRNQNLERAALAGEQAHWFKIVNYKTASRNGEPFDKMLEWASVLPNQGARMCSVQLKIRTVMRYLFSTGIKVYAPIIGIRKDEEHRVLEILASADSFEFPQFPLVDWMITEDDVLGFWKSNSYDLMLESYQGNCDLCFLKAKHKRVRMAMENPGLVNWWKDWEAKRALTCEGDGRFFRKGQPYIQIEFMASQPEMMFDKNDKDIPCACVERAFKKDTDE